LCAWLEAEPGVTTGLFGDQAVRARLDDPQLCAAEAIALPRNRLRELARMGEQARANRGFR
jgi:hypothetical protein